MVENFRKGLVPNQHKLSFRQKGYIYGCIRPPINTDAKSIFRGKYEKIKSGI
ncbi:Hypoticical protein [Pectobacterium parmentieri]|uniref:Hypoticical protein n=1 Tax=Pectobacterium parmentieri TaxID=1905730 RepID=A0A0H3I7N6_PECPM|nr:Hypoticical protein [Pectobacterium parmentieri]